MKLKICKLSLILFLAVLFTTNLAAQEKDTLFSESTFSGLKMRSIGPAFMSGRISDIAIHPTDESTWYITAGSGGVWKTENSGITWSPLFDDQESYSIGCISIDPQNPNVVWVGTGENVGGRHVGYGDGIYKSEDGGQSWKNMGLKTSEHISKIIIHPNNSNTIFVAAQGPLWSKGGQRGFYKSVDGGATWKKTLGDEEWTGVTDILIDPRNPDRLYAATWQRHRNVASYMGGGPLTAIYLSEDGGDSWKKLSAGLPAKRMGKIGLAISPQQPDVVYAAIELERRSGGVFRSENRGESWTKMSNTVSRGTGPHYYQELYASPHAFDRIYLMDVRIRVSENGGKKFSTLQEDDKHSDNHAMAFKMSDPDYLLVGTDGGLYESFDLAAHWRHFSNLPLTQFYKLAVDDAEPFYTIYGGTQDNNTQGGPSRTDNRHGIRNSDWFVTLYADGHQPATEPGNPDIVYSEWQEGNLCRIDRSTGEVVFIQPQAAEGDPIERFNWDSPILVSPHLPTRIYFASQRVWHSDDRGDSWTPISGDLSKNQDRMTMPIMGKQQSWDAEWDFVAMSNYNTITSLAESPLKEGLIYAGTDDGLIQITEDGGKNWRKVEVSKLPGVPETAFVNDIKADLFDENTVYVALDNHKFGDFTPYLFKSTNKGKSWESLRANIPDRTLVWRIVQDHEKSDLLFAATEFGVYFTIDGGEKWVKLTGDMPTISFRDLAIQRRENDLVMASFGRSFYVFDDYSVLRHVSKEQLQKEATLFPTRKAWWYIPKPEFSFGERGSRGADFYLAPNPPFGAVFTYFLSEGLQTNLEKRQANEAKPDQDQDVPFAGWDALEAERRQESPEVLLFIKDENGSIIRQLSCPVTAGFNRIAWDLRRPASVAINVDRLESKNEPTGLMVGPGTYTATLYKKVDGVVAELSGPISFEVEKLYDGALEGYSTDDLDAFWVYLGEIRKSFTATNLALKDAMTHVDAMQLALSRTAAYPEMLDKKLHDLKQELFAIDEQLNGNYTRDKVGEKNPPSIMDRMNVAWSGTINSTYGPTPTHLENLEIAETNFEIIRQNLESVRMIQIPELEQELIKAGAPWMRGQPIPER